MRRKFATSIACAMFAGCAMDQGVGGEGDVSAISAPIQLAPRTDPNGLTWVPSRYAPLISATRSFPSRGALRPQGRGPTLSIEELANKLRPVMLGPDNIEYSLDPQQALEFAEAVRNERRRDDERSEPGSGSSPFASSNVYGTGVFDGESRQDINAFAQDQPFTMIGVMLDRCTTFKMINAHTAMTSAHCMFDEKGWQSKPDIQFAAGSATPKPVIPGNCYAVTVPNGWIEDVGDDEYDFAVIKFREEGVEGGAFCNFDDYNVGAFGFRGVSGCTTDVGGDMAGYPGKNGPGTPPPGTWTYPTLFNDFRADGWTSCITYPNHLWYYNDNSGGQSGGPFFSTVDGNSQVRAINMSIWDGTFDDSNAGRRLDNQVIDFAKKFAGF